MSNSTLCTFVGLDTHKETITVAVLRPGADVCDRQTIPNTPEAVRKLVGSWKQPESTRACYEAGPCGYVLHRQLADLGVACEVIAPALIPKRPGVRVKTDRRDADNLARFHRAGELTAIRVPSEAEEAVRDLMRLREDMRADIVRARHRLSKFCLRHGRVFDGRAWSTAHFRWLASQHFDHPAADSAFAHYRTTLDLRLTQLSGLEEELARWAESEPFQRTVARLVSLRGISWLTALVLACEIVDFGRFATPDEFAAFVGLVPSEHSSGTSERRGSITKTGNGHVRRALVESAWAYRRRPSMGAKLARRSEGQPPEVLSFSWQTQVKLHGRYVRLVTRGKRSTVATVAVARELAKAACRLMQLQVA